MKQNSGAVSALMSVRDGARELCMGERTFRGLLAQGAIPVVRVSPGRIAVLRSDLEAYVRARRSGGGAEGTAA